MGAGGGGGRVKALETSSTRSACPLPNLNRFKLMELPVREWPRREDWRLDEAELMPGTDLTKSGWAMDTEEAPLECEEFECVCE